MTTTPKTSRRHALTTLSLSALGTAVMTWGCLAGSAQAASTAMVLAYTDGQVPQSLTNLKRFHANLSAVGLGSTWSLMANGNINDVGMTKTTQKIISYARSIALPAYPTVSDYDDEYGGFNPDVSHAVLATTTSRTHAVNSLVALAVDGGYAGINLDLEAVSAADGSRYSSFVSELATALHGRSLKLITSVPAKVADADPYDFRGYDYVALGKAVDYLQVMTYDEVGPGWVATGFNNNTWPGPESGLNWQNAVLSYTVSKMSAAKVLSGLPSYGYDFSTGKIVYWSAYNSVIASHSGAQLKRDTVSATPYATWGTVTPQPDGKAWSKKTAQPTLWYDDSQSIQAKAQRVVAYKLGGTSVWAMGYEDANFWAAVNAGLGR